MKEEKRGYIVMIFVNLIWGFGFIASEFALENDWGVFSLLFQKNLLGFIFCLTLTLRRKFWRNKKLMKTGIIAGFIYFIAYATQLFGQKYTTVTNTALITSLGIIMGPLFYWAIFKKKPAWYAFVACFLGLTGSFILSWNGTFEFHIGDILVFISSLLFALHLTYVGHEADDLSISCFMTVQFSVMAVCSGIALLISKEPLFGGSQGWTGVLYYAIISGILGMAGQFYSQRLIDSYKISLLLVLEGLFAAIFSILILHEPLTWQVLVGGGIMIFAVTFMGVMDLIRSKKVENK